MNKLAIVLVLIASFSCYSQKKEDIKITGNWYNFKNTKSSNSHYVETFINDNQFFSYDEFSGLSPSIEYEIDNNILYNIIDGERNKSGIIKIIDENTFSLEMNNGLIIMKRVTNGLLLEDYLFNKVNEEDYHEFFKERKSDWEKR
ncbi:MAG: hypothetical protein HRU26_05540 [Psychroserpens sp.]|nr:hypothetical protein [Psychroserpens sp.]